VRNRNSIVSILKPSNPDQLAKWLETVKPAEVHRQAESIKSLLDHRSVLVRWATAQTLGRSGVGGPELLKRLDHERNAIVITEITESLASLSEMQSLPKLQELAEKHSSPLVRTYAILAITDLAGKRAIPFLWERRSKERNSAVKATLDCALFVKGVVEILPDLLEDLKSRKPKVRNLVANLLYHYAPRRGRTLLLTALREALARETLPGIRGDIERAILRFS
jgi:hypothetical protein